MLSLLLRVVLLEVLALSQSLEDAVGALLQLVNSFTAGRLRLLQVKSGFNKRNICLFSVYWIITPQSSGSGQDKSLEGEGGVCF